MASKKTGDKSPAKKSTKAPGELYLEQQLQGLNSVTPVEPEPADQNYPVYMPVVMQDADPRSKHGRRMGTIAGDITELGKLMEQLGPGGIGPQPPEGYVTPGVETTTLPGGGDASGGGSSSSTVSASSESGGGGSEEAPPPPDEITWTNAYTVMGAPSWWRGMVPSQVLPDTEYATLVNSMIPYMSPEDQRTAATNLARLFPTGFSEYSAEKLNVMPPPEVTAQMRQQYTSAVRAQNALGALDNMRNALGRPDAEMGPGYAFLRDLAATIKQFSGTESSPQSRQQYLQQQAAVDPLLAETKGDSLSAYGPAARMVAAPFFSAGPLVSTSKDQSGQLRFGAQNRKLMG